MTDQQPLESHCKVLLMTQPLPVIYNHNSVWKITHPLQKISLKFKWWPNI
jgi:hypothetical protein